MLNKSTKNDGLSKCTGSYKYPFKGGNCRTENIVYKATLNYDLQTKVYIGFCSTQFRFRYATYNISLKGGVYETDTQLAK